MQYYNEDIVAKYADDPFDLLRDSQQLAHQQLAHQLHEANGNLQINRLLDVAVGLAKSFVAAEHFFEVNEFIGNDLSTSMLAHAAKHFKNFTAIHGDCLSISDHIPPESIDVAYAHYVLSYVDAQKLLHEIYQLLKPGGFLSLTTSTWENLRDIQTIIEKNIPFIFKRERYIKKYQGTIPLNADQVKLLLHNNGFKNIKIDFIKKSLTFTSFNEFWAYFAEAGWHVQASRLSGKLAIDKQIWRLITWGMSRFYRELRLPLTATAQLCVVTAQK